MKLKLVFKLRLRLLMVVFLAGIANVIAATYYVSSGGSDSNSGLSESQSWRTINKVNSSSFRPGDQILFNRGNVFKGTLSPRSSGQSGNPISIGAYGSGNNPVISGFTQVTGWTYRGGNIWESNSQVTSLNSCNLVAINGANTAMGRYPDSDYLTIDSHVSHTSITSDELGGSPNWSGAELVAKKNRWILDRTKITGHSGNTIYTSVPVTGYTYINNKGFFIQNDIRTLNRLNEWYFNSSTKKLSVYSSSQPSNVQVASIEILLDLLYESYLEISNIDFEGANEFAVRLRTCKYITIENCNFQFIGDTGIKGLDYSNGQPTASTGCVLKGNTFNHINNNAVRLSPEFGNTIITNNSILNTATLPGMGGSGDGTYSAIGTYADNTTISYNTIKNTGYLPVAFNGDNIYVYRNLIDTYCYIKDDGGGVYCASPGEGRRVIENIILNGLGSPAGNSPAVNPWDIKGAVEGIYLDNGSGAVTVQGNTIYNIENQGFLVHGNSGGNNVQDNTFFNCRGYNGIVNIQSSNSTVPQRNNIFKGNILVAAQEGQVTLKLQSTANDLNLFGDFDNNYYANPLGDNQILAWKDASLGSSRKGDLAAYRSYTKHGGNSVQFNQKVSRLSDIRFEYNAGTEDKLIALSNPRTDVTGKKYVGSIILKPFESVILFFDGNPSSAVANFTTNSTNVNVNESVTFTNTSSSASSYRWNFGDGQTSTATSPTHRFSEAGTYTVSLTAYSAGGNSSKSISITVNGPITTEPDEPTDPSEPTSPPNSGGSTVSLSDNFSDGNMNGWSVVDEGAGGGSSSWSVNDGKLGQTTNIYGGSASDDDRAGTYAYWNGAEAFSWSDYILNVDITSNDDDGIGVLFYYQNSNNYYRVELDQQRGFRKLIKKVNGVVTLLAEDNGSYTQGQNYPMEITVSDGIINVVMDGVSLFGGDISDNTLSGGTVAMYNWANAGSYYDNVEVALFDEEVGEGGSELECILFQHGVYSGASVALGLGMHDQLVMDNSASSILVPNGLRVTVYENSNGSGGELVLSETTDGFWNLTFDNGVSLNDNISSVLVEDVSAPTIGLVTLFTNGGYSGNAETLNVGMHILLSYNDAASSIEIQDGLKVTLYQHSSGSGGKIVLNESTDEFQNLTFDNGVTLDDNVSSVLIEEIITVETVTLYTNEGYSGNIETFEIGMFNQVQYNDEATSIQIPTGLRVTLYQHGNGTGGKIVLTETTDGFQNLTFDNGVNLNNNVSSVLVEDESTIPVSPITLYTNGGYSGSEEEFELGLFNVDYNDAASSMEIPKGMQVTLYENINGSGGKIIFTETTDRFWNYTFDNGSALNDNVSSVLVEYNSSLLKSGKLNDSENIDNLNGRSSFEEGVRIWPNPVTDYMNLEFNSAEQRTLTVYTMAGGVISSLQVSGQIEAIDLSDLKQGIYILQVVNMITNEVTRNQIIKK